MVVFLARVVYGDIWHATFAREATIAHLYFSAKAHHEEV